MTRSFEVLRQLVVAMLALGTLLAAAAHSQDAADGAWLSLPPPPSLEGLEPPVAEQLGQLRELVDAAVADPETGGAELVEPIGELARHYHAYDLREAAGQLYRIAMRLAPEDFRWTYLLGYLAHGDGDLDEAARRYERALELVPGVRPAMVRLAEVYLAQGRPREAEALLTRVLSSDPSAAAAMAVAGELALSEKRWRAAIELFESALELESGANRLYYPLAQAYRGLGEVDRARELLARRGTVGIKPADPLIDSLPKLTTGARVHVLRGRAAFDAGRFAEAEAEFRAAVEADPRNIAARVNLGAAANARGDTEAAIEVFREVVELAPGNSTAWFNLGSLHESRGEREAAADAFREAVLYEPGDAEIRQRFGDALFALGRLEQALEQYRRAVELEPAAALARLGEARVLAQLGRLGEARRRLEEGVDRLPASGLLTFALASILAAAPDLELRDGERALELAAVLHASRPSLEHAELVGQALAEAGRCAEAATWIDAVVANVEGLPPAVVEQLETRAEGYRAGPPCRP